MVRAGEPLGLGNLPRVLRQSTYGGHTLTTQVRDTAEAIARDGEQLQLITPPGTGHMELLLPLRRVDRGWPKVYLFGGERVVRSRRADEFPREFDAFAAGGF